MIILILTKFTSFQQMLEYSERVKRGGASTINNAARILTQRLNALSKEQKTAGGHIYS